jgi:hypothetical protein
VKEFVVTEFLGRFARLRKVTVTFVMSVRLFFCESPPTGLIFIKFDALFEKL